MKRLKRGLCLLLAAVMLLGTLPQAAASRPAAEEDGVVVLSGQNYEIRIETDGFRYGFYRPDGTEIVAAHQTSGLCFGPAGGTSWPVTDAEYLGLEDGVASFRAVNSAGGEADVKLHLFDRYVRFEILPTAGEADDGADDAPPQAPEAGAENSALLLPGSQAKQATVRWLDCADVPADGNYAVEARVKIPAGGTRSAGVFAHYQDVETANAFHLFFIKPGAVLFKRLNANGTSVNDMAVSENVDIKTETWYTLRLECEGNRFRGYVDGRQVLDVTDAAAGEALLKGPPGLRADQMDACFDDFRVTSLDGQTVWYENDFEYADPASVEEDFVYAMGTKSLSLTAPKTKRWLELTGDPEALAVVGDGSWTGYTVSARTALATGDEETRHGLLFGYQDERNYYEFRFDAQETLKLVKRVDGAETELASAHMAYAFDQPYTLSASLGDGALECSVDGKKLLEANDGTFAAGQAGLRTYGTTSKTELLTVEGGASFRDSFDAERLSGDWTVKGAARVTDGSADTPVPDPDPKPDENPYYVIDARLAGGIEYMYGLGDYGALGNTGGSVRETSNVVGVDRLASGSFTNWNSVARFISNFSIAPQLGFAQVLFETDDKRVAITDEQTLLGACRTRKVDGLYYFFGSMEEIYGDYKAVRNAAGYVDAKPHYEMFGLGWEAFGSLGWNAYQSSVLSTLRDYLDSGYHLTWGVIGSGFWAGDRKGVEGTTTSFGMWDDAADPNGRGDGLPNPRFPDPDALKQFFRDNDMKLLLGLRNHLKLPAGQGGKQDVSVDGEFVQTALERGYFLTNDDGSLYKVSAKYPTGGVSRGPVGVIDAENPEAVKWFSDMADLWGVDGFKEDCMMLQTTHHDDNWNKLLQYMAQEKDDYLIVRNASYCLPGDVLRINDANYGTSNNSFNNSPDRMVINALAYAASGQSNVYPDIIGGTGANVNDPAQQNYIVRNAYMAALCPSQSVGVNVLKMNSQEMKDAAFRAINWHSTYAPYIYDAALKSYETGYPLSMTPLYIAYPDDPNTYEMIDSEKRMFQWMLGESVLAAPLFGTDHRTAVSRDVYLPEGKWIQYDTGEVFYGPCLLEDWESPIDRMPAFIGGKGVLIGEDLEHEGSYFAQVFPVAGKGSVYRYTFVDGETASTVANRNDGWAPAALEVWDTTANERVAFTHDPVNGSIRFAFTAGHDYELRGGKGSGTLTQALLSAERQELEPGETMRTQLSARLDDGGAADLAGAEVVYRSSDEAVASVDRSGAITAHRPGTAEVWAEVTLKNDEGTPVTVRSSAVTVTVPDSSITIDSGVTLRDGFEDAGLGGWTDHTGNYAVRNGALAYSGAGGRGTIVTAADVGSDYTIEADITASGAVPGATFGLVFRYNNSDSNYLFVYTWGTGLRFLKRYNNGQSAGLAQNVTDRNVTLEPDTTYRFKAEAEGERFTLWIDGEKMMEVRDDHKTAGPIAAGPCGFYASNQAVAFDNVTITPKARFPLSISGSAQRGDEVKLGVLGLEFPAELRADGSWSCSLAYLPAGEHAVAARLYGADGALLAESAGTVTVAEEAGAEKQALLEAVRAADQYARDDYTEDSWQAFQDALLAARQTLLDPEAPQEAALERLDAAASGLARRPAAELPIVPEIVLPGEEIDETDVPLSSLPFLDVDHEKWYAQSIANVVAKGLMEGLSELMFAPEDAMTRGMMAQALYALAQKPEIKDAASFLDLADGVSYADAVAWGAENGLIKGYSDTEFGGEDALNRQQLAALLYRYAEQIEKLDMTADADALNVFPDRGRVSAWAEEAMAWAVSKELVEGRTDGTLDPRATITRAEAAAILDRFSKQFLA